jgi:hypothetical protein
VIETAELALAGRAVLESATGKLDGRFAVAFSPELSATMREEQSRAADLFWDLKAQRVSFGFVVGRLATAPSVRVDWESAVRGVAERKLVGQLRRLIEGKPGAGTTGGATTASGETAASGEATPSVEATASGEPTASSEASPSVSGLVAEIKRTRWTGPVLVRELSVEGAVRGAGIERAALTIIDARGNELQKIARLRPVADQLVSATDRDAEATLAWRAEIEGKRLLAARFPVRVTITVYDRGGRSASATREVDR